MLSDQFLASFIRLYGESSRMIFELKKDTSPKDITPQQMGILEYLYYQGKDNTVGEISDCLNITMPNTSREIRKLVEKGYLEKKAFQQDKRVFHIQLSERGHETMTQVFQKIFANANQRWHGMTREEQDQVMDQMNAIVNKLLL